MKKFYPVLLLFATPVILLLMANSGGSPGGKSGSPGDNGSTCTDCHGGSAASMTGWISTNVPFQGYTPGQTYTITATGTHTGVVKFGFELTVEDSDGTKVGTLQLAEPSRTKFTNGGDAVTHTAAGNVPSGSTNTWTVNWVAPSGVEGNVGIYAAFNAANGNGNTGGDVIYKSSRSVWEYIPQPSLVAIDPDSAIQGEIVTTMITASNTKFTEQEPVIFLNNNENPFETVSATSINVINDVTVEATFNFPSNATPGFWDLNVDELILDKSFTVNILSGFADNGKDMIKIYPNPASRQFFVENMKGATLSIFRMGGEILTRISVVNDKQEVNITQLSKGFYLVKTELNGIISVQKLLVN